MYGQKVSLTYIYIYRERERKIEIEVREINSKVLPVVLIKYHTTKFPISTICTKVQNHLEHINFQQLCVLRVNTKHKEKSP
jgi:hypothetical protein